MPTRKDMKIRSSGGGEFDCYLVTPDGSGKMPAMVLASAVHGVDQDIRAIADETAGRPTQLEPIAKAVLRAAREMTTDLTVSEQTFAALRRELDHERLTDLVLTIGFYNGVVRILATLQIDVEDGYHKYLDEFPLPKDRGDGSSLFRASW